MVSQVTTLPRDRLTPPSFSDLLRRNSQDPKNFSQYLRNQVLHRFGWFNLNVDLETSEKGFDSVEKINKGVLARAYIFGCL
jgi:hypothetical protein